MRKYRYLNVALSIAIIISMLVYLVPETVSAATSSIFYATDSTKGSSTDLSNLYVGYYSGAVENAAIKFNLSTVTTTPASATLRIYVIKATSYGTDGAFSLVGGTDDSWTSPAMPSNMTSGITPIGAKLTKSGLSDGWNNIDVTSFIQNHLTVDASKIVSLYLMGFSNTSNNDINIASAVSGTNAPQLILTYGTDEARLSGISIGNVSLLDFDSDVYTYYYEAAFGTNLSTLAFTSTAYDSTASQSGWTYDSTNKKWSVTVTAKDGITKHTYSVTVSSDTATATETSNSVSISANDLYVGYYGGAIENAAIKFDLSTVTTIPASAVLKLYVHKASCTGLAGAFSLKGGTDDLWTSPNLPSHMTTDITEIKSSITYSELSEGWNYIDVTSYVQNHLTVDSSKIISLYLMGLASTANNDICIYSAASGYTAPRLVLTYGNSEARLSSINIGGTNLPSFAIDTYDYSYAAIVGANLANLTFSSTTYDSNASQSPWVYDAANHKWSVTVTAKDGTTKKTYTVNVSNSDTVAAISSSSNSGTAGSLYVGYYKGGSFPSGVIENAAVKFDLSGCTTAPTKVLLKIFVNSASCTGTAGAFDLYGCTDDSWVSPALPSSSSLLPTAIRANIKYSDLVGGWNTIDVTSFVVSQFSTDNSKIISLYFKGITNTVSNDISINAASSGSYAPCLSLTFVSSEAGLSGITANGTPLSGFSSNTYSYSYVAPHDTDLSTMPISSTLIDATASQSAWTYDSANHSWSVTVTAQDTTTVKTYTVHVSAAAQSSDATLSSISISGTSLSGFTSSKLDYFAAVPHGTVASALGLSSVVHDHMGVQGIWTYDSANHKWSVTVTSEDSLYTKTYTVTINVLPSMDATLKSIKVNGTDVDSFSPGTMLYTVAVPHDTPITSSDFVSITNDDGAQQQPWVFDPFTGKWVERVTAEDGITELFYSVIINELPSTDATLSGIKIDGTDLGGFSSSTYSYAYNVVHGTNMSALALTSTFSDHMATGTWAYDAALKTWSITVTAQDNATKLIYKVMINELPSTDATLTSIAVNGTDIGSFSPTTMTYTVAVPHGTVVTPESIVSVASDNNAQQQGWIFEMHTGEWIEHVKAEDGITVLTYILTINVLPSTDASLKSLTIGGTSLAGFTPSTYTYNYDVVHGTDMSALVLASVCNDHGAIQGTWTYNPVTHVWSNTVTAEDKTTTLVYTVAINELASTDATLTGIKIGGTDLNGFASSIYTYNFDVVHGTNMSALLLTSTISDHMATGSWIYDAAAHAWSITVTAEDKITTLTYTVAINELPSTDAKLTGIKIGGTSLSGFSSSIYTYNFDVVHGTDMSALALTSTFSDHKATGTWVYDAATNKWSITVTAEDGTTKLNYTVAINELPSTDATLSGIKIGGTALVGFSSSTYDYPYDVVHGTDMSTLALTGTVSDHMATGTSWAYDAATKKWSITVTAEDKITTHTYTVTINELPSTDATLKSLTIGGKILNGFTPSQLHYTYAVVSGTDASAFVLGSECNDHMATQGAWVYDANKKIWSVTVTAEDTSKTSTYEVAVTEFFNPPAGVLGDYRTNSLLYQTHVQDIGWQGNVQNGVTSGTSGQSKRMEAIRIKLSDLAGGIEYCTHVQDIGWMNWVADGALSGTTGQSKRMEAIKIRLTGEAAEKYDIYYRVHSQNFGWLDWAKNGESSGTAGYSYRMEAIQIVLVAKGDPAPGATAKSFVQAVTAQK